MKAKEDLKAKEDMKAMERKKVAVIRIRGSIGLKKEIVTTFKLLRLYKKNYCIVIENTPYYIGMLKKIRHHATWGEMNEETFKAMLEKRGKLARKKSLTQQYLKQKTDLDFNEFTKEFFAFNKNLKDVPGLKLFFRLSPPRNGFESKGIKVPFSQGGVLGYRKDKINELIARMI